MARMEEYDKPKGPGAWEYEKEYGSDSNKVSCYDSSLRKINNFGIDVYKTSLRYGFEHGFVYTDAEKAELFTRFQTALRDYGKDERSLLSNETYILKFNVDPNNPYLEQSDVVTRDTAYARMALAAQTYGFTVVHEEDQSRQKTEGEQVLVIPKPMVEVDVSLPQESTQKPTEQI